MPWFYAEDGTQTGPVDDDEFHRLIRAGRIEPTTLVWREGMANWEPLSAVRPGIPPMSPAPLPPAVPQPGQVICAECGKAVHADETVQMGHASICSACKPTYLQKLREGAITFAAAPPAPMRYAGFWIRVAAYVIDQVILNVVSLPFTLWLSLRAQQSLQAGLQMGRFDWASYGAYVGLSSAIGLIIALIYNVWLVGRFAATPGKMIVKIKIVKADGSKVSYLRALGRFGGQFVSSLACGIGYLMPIWDQEKRALHDHMCNTRVVYKR